MLSETDLVGIDVGGANLKVADGLGRAASEPFEMWRRPRELADAIRRILAPARAARIVATMTGEIADCFSGRVEGVRHIVDALERAADTLPERPSLSIYAVSGEFLTPREAIGRPFAVAASNWHAAARLAASMVPQGNWLMVDVGSTTTDVVPIRDRLVVPRAFDDAGRMASGELVYTGVERTPVASLVRSLPWGDGRRPVASETFATTRDVWLLLGGLPEDPASRATADGRAATREAARDRLARMLLVEPERFTESAAIAAAHRVASAQVRLLAARMRRLLAELCWMPDGIAFSGHGRCLAERAVDHLGLSPARIDLAERLGSEVSRVGPAHAVAAVARGLVA